MGLWVWASIAWGSSLCADIPTGDEALGQPPDHWPEYPGRCLDVGSKRETLLQRARRCIHEEPEDHAVVELLGVLGDASDIPVLEAIALRGLSVYEATQALEALGGDASRRALVHVACFGQNPAPAARLLADTPRAEEVAIYAQHLQGQELAVVLGPIGTEQSRSLLMKSEGPESRFTAIVGMARDLSLEGQQALEALVETPRELETVVRSLAMDHPQFVAWMARAAADDAPSVREAVVRKGRDVDDAQALLWLQAGLADASAEVRATAASEVARAPDRYASLVASVSSSKDSAIVLGWIRTGERDLAERVDALWGLRTDPAVGDDVIRTLLQSLETTDPSWVTLVEELEADAESNVQLLRIARSREHRVERPASEKRAPFEVTTPTYSRDKVKLRDGKKLLERARIALDADPKTPWALAVLPWVGEDADLRYFEDDKGMVRRLRSLADMGSPAALAKLEASARSRGGDWAWSRTPQGWGHVLTDVASFSELQGIGRPEAMQVRALLQSREEPDAPTQVGAQRLWLATGTLRRESLFDVDALMLQDQGPRSGVDRVAASSGLRWVLLARLPTLDEAPRQAALESLVNANWSYDEPPDVVVQAAATMQTRGAYQVLLQAGQSTQVMQAMDGDRAEARFAYDAVFSSQGHIHPAVVEPMRARIAEGRLPEQYIARALVVPELRQATLQAVLAHTVAFRRPCDVLNLVEVEGFEATDDWIVDVLRTCQTVPGRARFDTDTAKRLQARLLLDDPLTSHVFRVALQLDDSDPEIVRPFLTSRDPLVRMQVVGHLGRAGLGPGMAQVLLAWTTDGVYDDLRHSMMEVLTLRDPAFILPYMTKAVAKADDWTITRNLMRMNSDGADQALIPVIGRGTEHTIENVAKHVQKRGGPVYQANKALVDGVIAPRWEKKP